MEYREIIFFIELKVIIGFSNMFMHSCYCVFCLISENDLKSLLEKVFLEKENRKEKKRPAHPSAWWPAGRGPTPSPNPQPNFLSTAARSPLRPNTRNRPSSWPAPRPLLLSFTDQWTPPVSGSYPLFPSSSCDRDGLLPSPIPSDPEIQGFDALLRQLTPYKALATSPPPFFCITTPS